MPKNTIVEERDVSKLQQQLENITIQYEATINQLQVAHAVYSIVRDADNQPVDYIILNFNKKYEEITGLTLEKARWKSIRDFFGEYASLWESHLSKAVVTGQTVQFEIQNPVTERWTDIIVNPPGNNLLLVTFTDVTERKNHELEILESRAMLAEMGKMARIGGWEHNLITKKTYWTAFTYELLGLDPDTDPPGFDDHFNFLPDDYRLSVKAHYDNAINDHKPFDVEARLINTTGKSLWVSIHGEPIIRKGTCIKVKGFIQDITSVKQAEVELRQHQEELSRKNEEYQTINEEFMALNEELNESNEKITKLNDRLLVEIANSERNEALYRTIFNTIREGIFIYSSKDKLEYINPAACELHGRSEAELLAMKPVEFIHPDTYQVFLDFIKTVESGQEFIGEASGVTKDNQRFDVMVYGCPITIDGKQMYYSRVRDVTLQRRYERQLEEQNKEILAQNEEYMALNEELEESNMRLRKANQELDSFVYRVSHDMRAPIASSLGLAMLCLQETSLDEMKKYAKLQYDCLKRLDNFIKDILDYSRNTRLDIVRETVDLEKLINEIVSTHQVFDFANRKIDFRLNISGNKTLESDTTRLKIILHNLLSNAFKYYDSSKDKSYVRVDIMQYDHSMKIAVKDNGIGIGREHHSRIFDMFYRGTEKRTGSGIGLYIVKDCLTKLKGTIDFNSMKGKGTEFIITLPLSTK